jgi:hypothetical protein
MKVKTLRFKESKEFVHIMEDGSVATSPTPDVLPMTASMDALKKYYEISGHKEPESIDEMEVVEFDFIESGEVGADIRNKLSPPLNLVEMLEEYFNNPEVPDFQKLEKLIQDEMKQTKISVDYLSKLF